MRVYPMIMRSAEFLKPPAGGRLLGLTTMQTSGLIAARYVDSAGLLAGIVASSSVAALFAVLWSWRC